jgi:putative beta barrel porin BBP7
MANGLKLGAILLAALLLATPARAQFLFFGKKPLDDPPPAFSNGQAPQEPQFAPDPKSLPKDAPQFCPGDDPHTPFVPVEEENRNAFLDYKTSEPAPLMLWLRADYLNWQFKRPNLGAILVTTDTAPNAKTDFGALGQAHTQVLLNSGPFSQNPVQGGRLTAGFCPGFFMPIEVSGFALQKSQSLFTAISNGGPNDSVLARPILSSQNGQESAILGSFPGLAAGSISVISNTNLWGIEANAFFNVVDLDAWSIDLYVGYRYQELRENVLIFNPTTALNGPVIPFDGSVPGVTAVNRYDQFATRNRFNGGQMAFRSSLNFGRLDFILDGKLALGETQELVNIFGTTVAPTADSGFRGAPVTNGGVLAVPSNSGTKHKHEFTYIPEFDFNVGFQVHRCARVFAGISWMYWNHVVRPGDQISNVIDTRQVPTSNFFTGQTLTQPPQPFFKTDFFAYGFNVGVLIGF